MKIYPDLGSISKRVPSSFEKELEGVLRHEKLETQLKKTGNTPRLSIA
jgi:hypothetical protein